MFTVAALVFVWLPAVLAETFQVHHRVVHQSGPIPPFSSRGSIEVSSYSAPPIWHPDANAIKELEGWLSTGEPLETGYYQLALERPASNSPQDWDIQSVKLCHVPTSAADVISLSVDESGSHALAFDYYVSPIPHDGSCPKAHSRRSSQGLLSNTTVAYRTVVYPVTIPLRAPARLTAEGEPIKPVPEQTFIQKYWMYIAGAFIILLVAPGPAEPPSANEAK